MGLTKQIGNVSKTVLTNTAHMNMHTEIEARIAAIDGLLRDMEDETRKAAAEKKEKMEYWSSTNRGICSLACIHKTRSDTWP